jgi:hypothetical protein
VDYEDVSLTIRESNGQVRRIICEGYIGYEALGVWDEIIVMETRLNTVGPLLTQCIKELERRHSASRGPSGSGARNGGTAMELTVVLSDGCEVRVAMKGLRLEPSEAERGGMQSLRNGK